jgi:hypothetical protein
MENGATGLHTQLLGDLGGGADERTARISQDSMETALGRVLCGARPVLVCTL